MNTNSSQHVTTPLNIVERGGQTVSTSAVNKINVETNVTVKGYMSFSFAVFHSAE